MLQGNYSLVKSQNFDIHLNNIDNFLVCLYFMFV